MKSWIFYIATGLLTIASAIPLSSSNNDTIAINDGRCGPEYGKCSEGECCSSWGWCGKTSSHCNINLGCQTKYGKCDKVDDAPTAAPTDAPVNQEKLTDDELASALYVMGQMYPDGFTLDLKTMRQPTEGLIVPYNATLNSVDRKSLTLVIKHAREHDNLVGGRYDSENGKYYYNSYHSFPESDLDAAMKFARETKQDSIHVISMGIDVNADYEQKDIRVIFDGDIGSSTDDLFALMMLYRYMDMKRCTLLGVIVDRMGRSYGDVIDIMNNYYGHPDIPIGVETQGVKNPHVFIDYHNAPYARTIEGEPIFKRSIGDDGSYMEGYKLYRKLLSEQPDHSVTITSIGFVTTLSRLLESKPDEFSSLNGVELVRTKVKNIYIMGGVFGDSVEPDFNFSAAIEFSMKFFELLPKEVELIYSPGEVGDPFDYRPEMVISDINWTDVHPIKWVYQHVNCDTGQKMWDPQAIIHAIEGDDFYKLSERGFVTLTPQGETIFKADPKGNARYQLPGDDQWNDMVLKYIRLMTIQH